MFALLLSLLTRFSLPQLALALSAGVVATVAVAGSPVTMSELTGGQHEQQAAQATKPVLAVLTSPIDVEPEWTVNRVSYRLAEIPTSIAAITFTLVAPEVQPSVVTVQAIHPVGAHYRCSMVPSGADVAVTCPTGTPALPVAQANRLYIEVRG